jgi:preprotein translocase subunit SecA
VTQTRHAEAVAFGVAPGAAGETEPEEVAGGWRAGGAAVAAAPRVRTAPEVGRNDPCPCGSGKKYKKCHMLSDQGQGSAP